MLALCAIAVAQARPTERSITSPDGSLKLTVTIDKDIRWSVTDGSTTVIAPSQIAMQVGPEEVWGVNPILRKATTGSIDERIPSPLYKKAEVEDRCTTLTLSFKGDYAIELRAYDNAAAYRFVSTRKAPYTVKHEVAEFNFEDDNMVYCSYVRSNEKKSFAEQYYNSFEGPYVLEPMSKMGNNRLMYLLNLFNNVLFQFFTYFHPRKMFFSIISNFLCFFTCICFFSCFYHCCC